MQTSAINNRLEGLTAKEWFSGGKRILYNASLKKIIPTNGKINAPNLHHVFLRIESDASLTEKTNWATFLPGFPDGSYGWARVNQLLGKEQFTPRLFVEYIGQGDSDKPANYSYGTAERADLVEALWQANGVKSTFVITFDFSSLVLMELLNRQKERQEKGLELFTKIERVLIINGGLFADAHSHPWFTTPLLKTSFGKMGAWFAQRSKFAFSKMMESLWSKDYKVTKEEINELFDAIGRRNGMAFLNNAAHFVDEHKVNAKRWDFGRIYLTMQDTVSFHIAGSLEDPFEPRQIVKAEERLGNYGLDIKTLPGGHLTTSEHPDLIVQLINASCKQLT